MKSSDFPQLELMRSGIDYSFEISLRQFKAKVRPLTNFEIVQATSNAVEAFNALPESQRLQVTMSLLNAMYQLEKASSTEPGLPGVLSLALLQKMTPEEVNHLWKQYVRVTDLVNPSFEQMPLEELERLVLDLKKNSDQLSLLTDLSISKLIAVCLELLKNPPT